MSAPSDDEWPEGLTEDGDKLFLKDKLLVPENRIEELIDHWHNAQVMHPGRDKMQQDLEWRFKFLPGYYALLDKYCSDCAVCRATKSPNHSTAGNPVYTAIPEAPMRSVAMDVFAMSEVTVEGETYDWVILALDRHSGYIVAVPGKKSKKKDNKDKHGVGLQAKTVANAMIRHWLTMMNLEWSYIFPESRITLRFVVPFILLGDIVETKVIREATLKNHILRLTAGNINCENWVRTALVSI